MAATAEEFNCNYGSCTQTFSSEMLLEFHQVAAHKLKLEDLGSQEHIPKEHHSSLKDKLKRVFSSEISRYENKPQNVRLGVYTTCSKKKSVAKQRL